MSPRHILLGCLHATTLLQEIGVDAARMEANLRDEPGSERLQGKLVVEAAIEEARLAKTRELSPVLILAGIARLHEFAAARVLAQHGISLERLRSLRQPL